MLAIGGEGAEDDRENSDSGFDPFGGDAHTLQEETQKKGFTLRSKIFGVILMVMLSLTLVSTLLYQPVAAQQLVCDECPAPTRMALLDASVALKSFQLIPTSTPAPILSIETLWIVITGVLIIGIITGMALEHIRKH